MSTSDHENDSHDADEVDEVDAHQAPSHEPGGPYFGRLLVVLLLAVAFCGFMTWYLGNAINN